MCVDKRRERRKKSPARATPFLQTDKGQLVPFASPGPGQFWPLWKEPLFLQLLGALSEGAAVGSWGFQSGSGQ